MSGLLGRLFFVFVVGENGEGLADAGGEVAQGLVAVYGFPGGFGRIELGNRFVLPIQSHFVSGFVWSGLRGFFLFGLFDFGSELFLLLLGFLFFFDGAVVIERVREEDPGAALFRHELVFVVSDGGPGACRIRRWF